MDHELLIFELCIKSIMASVFLDLVIKVLGDNGMVPIKPTYQLLLSTVCATLFSKTGKCRIR